ncbi:MULTISPECIES: ABC transporter permease [unclassified Streptomyces]|uniref:ABC transporter permease n=1 Tax=unclassified Streptomyces TaxID=2593676 RepID=UPI00117DF7FA|nr:MULTISPECIES: ABC transporter permease subunit [unclassified Streptomyces]TRO60837.1 ABC transporter permease subunit [Streptomyces sp. IB201691-2A2]
MTATAPAARTAVRRLPRAAVPPPLVGLLVGAVLWEVVARSADAAFLPPASAVVARLWEMTVDGLILGSLASSLTNLVLGFAISLVLGLTLGVLMGRYRTWDAALGVYMYALLTAPSLVFAPVFFSLFGPGRASIVAVVVMYSLFIIVISTASAVRAVPERLTEMSRLYGASERQLLVKVVVPAALPLAMAGIRLGIGRAVTGMINGEMFIAVVGLGRVLTQAGGRFDSESVLAVLLAVVLVALGAVGLVQWADRRVNGWLPRTARE